MLNIDNRGIYSSKYKRFGWTEGSTGSLSVKTGTGKLFGIFVTDAQTTPTMVVYDSAAASGTIILNTFTPVAATMYRFPNILFETGCFVSTGGSVKATVFYE